MHVTYVVDIGPVGVALVVAGFFGLIALLVIISARANRRRQRAFAGWAAKHRLSYSEYLPEGRPSLIRDGHALYATDAVRAFLQQFDDFPPLESGYSRNIKNVMRGANDTEQWLIFNYWRWVETPRSGKRRRSAPVETTCVMLRTRRNLCRYQIEPRLPLVGLIMTLAAPGDIVATGDDAFDKHFIVRAQDAGNALGALSPAVRAYLLGLYHARGRWYRHLYVHDTLVMVTEQRAPAKHLDAMVGIARGFVQAAVAQGPGMIAENSASAL